jgi:hypothetical protein
MPVRLVVGALAIALVSCGYATWAQAWDDALYPDWKGQWVRTGRGGTFDPTKPGGRGQQPPLTPEYQAVWEANLAEARAGGQAYNGQAHCLPGGMPRMMIPYEPMEIIVTPGITYVQFSFNNEFRRIYTDGRDWPKDPEGSFSGYSIGRWSSSRPGGPYDALDVETRALKGPRTIDASGIPLHKDNQTIVREHLYSDAADPDTLHDDITTIDHALTRPWTVNRYFHRVRDPNWVEHICAEGNQYTFIQGDTYLIGPGGYLMPAKKGQNPPDLRYFNQPRK